MKRNYIKQHANGQLVCDRCGRSIFDPRSAYIDWIVQEAGEDLEISDFRVIHNTSRCNSMIGDQDLSRVGDNLINLIDDQGNFKRDEVLQTFKVIDTDGFENIVITIEAFIKKQNGFL